MGNVRLQEQQYVEVLQHVQEAVTIFKETAAAIYRRRNKLWEILRKKLEGKYDL